VVQGTLPNTGARQRLITPGVRRFGSVVSGDVHICAWVIRGEARDHVQCDAPRFCGILSQWNIEVQPTRTAKSSIRSGDIRERWPTPRSTRKRAESLPVPAATAPEAAPALSS
jgi:hypothetical protein